MEQQQKIINADITHTAEEVVLQPKEKSAYVNNEIKTRIISNINIKQMKVYLYTWTDT